MKHFIGISIICVFTLHACLDEIDLNIDSENVFYVVDGQITDKLQLQTIRLSSSAIIGRGNDNIFESLTSAEVRLFDSENSSFLFEESINELGTYQTMMQAVPEMEYRLEVKLANGDLIKSRPSMINPTPKIDSITFDVKILKELNAAGNTVENEYVDIYVNTTTGNESPFLKWRIEGEYEFLESPRMTGSRTCYIKQLLDLNSITVLDTRNTQNSITGQFIKRVPIDGKFDLLYCFHVQQYSISEQEYDFLSNSAQLLDLEGGLFDLPPGKVQSNLFLDGQSDAEVYGYLSFVQEESRRRFITADDLDLIIYSPCYSGFSFDFGCFDCTSKFQSSLVKPNYWPR